MKNQRTIVGFQFLIFVLFISGFSSCAMPTISRFAEDDLLSTLPRQVLQISKSDATITLAWNYDEPANVKSYKVYFRARGDTLWIPLVTIIPPEPFHEIDKAEIGIGEWEFGVSVVTLNPLDAESEIHTCLDSNAEPDSGWYLLWEN